MSEAPEGPVPGPMWTPDALELCLSGVCCPQLSSFPGGTGGDPPLLRSGCPFLSEAKTLASSGFLPVLAFVFLLSIYLQKEETRQKLVQRLSEYFTELDRKALAGSIHWGHTELRINSRTNTMDTPGFANRPSQSSGSRPRAGGCGHGSGRVLSPGPFPEPGVHMHLPDTGHLSVAGQPVTQGHTG